MNHFLFHRVLKTLRERDIVGETLLVALSGGLDSSVLLHLLSRMSLPLQLKLFGVYVHHGKADNSSVEHYRDQAGEFVKSLCSECNIPFLFSKSERKLSSEKDMREFRHSRLRALQMEKKARWIALGHNSDDALETRLINLVRGCGLEGLKSMDCVQSPLLRPLSFSSREDIRDYAQKNKLKWLEDPSNKDPSFFRNWLRREWLPLLKKKRPQALSSLSRSLSLIGEEASGDPALDSFISEKGIKRKSLLELGPLNQRRVLAQYMRRKGLSSYGLSHVKELQKHINRSQKTSTLGLLKKTWHITPEFIFIKD